MKRKILGIKYHHDDGGAVSTAPPGNSSCDKRDMQKRAVWSFPPCEHDSPKFSKKGCTFLKVGKSEHLRMLADKNVVSNLRLTVHTEGSFKKPGFYTGDLFFGNPSAHCPCNFLGYLGVGPPADRKYVLSNMDVFIGRVNWKVRYSEYIAARGV